MRSCVHDVNLDGCQRYASVSKHIESSSGNSCVKNRLHARYGGFVVDRVSAPVFCRIVNAHLWYGLVLGTQLEPCTMYIRAISL